MNENPDVGVQFHPDFAARVLESADRLVKRRRVRMVAGASTLCAGLAAAVVWLNISAVPQGLTQDRNPVFATASPSQIYKEPGARPAEPASSPDALTWFFPDAQPLVRYAAEDSADDSDNSAGALFDDD